jgi:hypothetical protein
MTSRLIVIFVLLLIAAYDIPAMLFGWTTISQQVRVMDRQLNGLIKFGWLALWGHFFLPAWRGPTGI